MFHQETLLQLMVDVAIVGAGPAGLACALEARKAGLSCRVIDKGTVVDAIRRFPVNLTFFSTSDLLEIGGIPFLSSGFRPTRVEILRYYQRVAKERGLEILPHTEVTAVRQNGKGFELHTSAGAFPAWNVVVSTGYFDGPNPFDVPGTTLPKVRRYYDEPYAYVGRKVAVVGGKNSAVEVALDLYRAGVDVTLIHRGKTFTDGVKYWILPD
ncbi:MAG: NAD(P)-binding domain-containing protein, partial [Bacteroidota bacterium]